MDIHWGSTGFGKRSARSHCNLLDVTCMDTQMRVGKDQMFMLHVHLVKRAEKKRNFSSFLEKTSNTKGSRRMGVKEYLPFLQGTSLEKECMATNSRF